MIATLIEIIMQSFIDAYVQVVTWVALTLFIFGWIERKYKKATDLKENNRYFDIFGSSMMGALPGCGGAIIVVTRFTTGQLSFANLVAVLTSTMGDASFLLLSQQPKTGIAVITTSILVGTCYGFIIEWAHPKEFMMPKKIKKKASIHTKGIARSWAGLWFTLILINLPYTLINALNIKIQWSLGFKSLAMIGMMVVLISEGLRKYAKTIPINTLNEHEQLIQEVIATTNFVTLWVIMAFLSYEIPMSILNINLDLIIQQNNNTMPLLCALIGLLPGCGPQILVTSLFLNGKISLAGLMANAISNDGDALFPVIAKSPKAAILATLYGLVPALMIGYGMFLLI